MTHPGPIRRALARFRRDEGGSVTVEALLILLPLAWVYVGCLVFFQAFHAESVTVKAAYTISDALSRERGDITPEFMDSLYALQGFLVGADAPRRLRVTVFHRNGDDYDVCWSEPRGGGAKHTDATLTALSDRIPLMADGDSAILTETWVDHSPAFESIIDAFTHEDVVVTRIRNGGGQLHWNPNNNQDPTTRVC